MSPDLGTRPLVGPAGALPPLVAASLRVGADRDGYGVLVEHPTAGHGATLCRSCGTGVPPGAAYCPGCGAATTAGTPDRWPGRPPSMPVLPGYTALEPLGSGGSSIVYRARQESLDREVAVKLIREGIDDPRVWRRFEREARIIASLSGHPNVVTIYDVGRTELGQPFLVTELLDRGSLSEVISQQGPLDPGAAMQVGQAVAAALSAAHHRDILHRDVKPGNVLLSSHGDIKLADFGVARLMAGHSQTTTGSIAFTPQHVAPEVLRGEPEGPASDVYGLASTVVTALLGRPPFASRDDERIEAVMWRKLAEPPPALGPPVPAPLARLLTDCLAIAPGDRPPLAVVRSELTRLLDQHVTATAAPGGRRSEPAAAVARVANPERGVAGATLQLAPAELDDDGAGRPRHRPGWWALASAIAALVLVAGMVALTVRGGGDPDGDLAATATSQPDTEALAAPPTAPSTTPSTTAPTTAAPAAPPEASSPSTLPGASAPEPGTAPVRAEEAVAFVRAYYDTVAAGDHRSSWAMLSPEFRAARSLTFERYANYWRTNSIQVGQLRFVPDGGGESGRVQFDARYVTPDGVVNETDELTLRRGGDGRLTITDQRIVL